MIIINWILCINIEPPQSTTHLVYISRTRPIAFSVWYWYEFWVIVTTVTWIAILDSEVLVILIKIFHHLKANKHVPTHPRKCCNSNRLSYFVIQLSKSHSKLVDFQDSHWYRVLSDSSVEWSIDWEHSTLHKLDPNRLHICRCTCSTKPIRNHLPVHAHNDTHMTILDQKMDNFSVDKCQDTSR